MRMGGGPGYPSPPTIRFGPGGPLPRAVRQLLIANAAVFVLAYFPGIDGGALSRLFGLVPADVFAGGRVWQLVTYMFLHGGLLHLLMNMFLLWMFGTSVNRAWGDRDFLVYYFVCGLGGALSSWAFAPSSTIPTIGASAAVLGVLLAYALLYPDRKVLIYFLIPVKVKYFVWFLAALDLWAAFDGQRDGIAHFAHLGGMLFGWLYLKQDWRTAAFGRKLRGQRARWKMANHRRQAQRRKADAAEIDRILDKIHAQGMDSLTPEELRILREASRH